MVKKYLMVILAVFLLSLGCATTPSDNSPSIKVAEYNKIGNDYYAKGQMDAAIASYQKALEMNPKDADAYMNRGEVYATGLGKFDPAIGDFTQAIEIDPKNVQAYYKRGQAHKKKGDFDRAIADFSKAIEFDPKSAEVYCDRGVVYGRDKGRFDLAISDFNKAIEINPQLGEAYLNKALAYDKSGRKEEAITTYKAFIQHVSVQYEQYLEYAKDRINALGK